MKLCGTAEPSSLYTICLFIIFKLAHARRSPFVTTSFVTALLEALHCTLFRLRDKHTRLKELPISSCMYNAYTHLLIKTCLNIYLFFGPTPASLGDCNMSYKPFMEDLKNSTSRQKRKMNTLKQHQHRQRGKNKVETSHAKVTEGTGWQCPLKVCFLPSCISSFISWSQKGAAKPRGNSSCAPKYGSL